MADSEMFSFSAVFRDGRVQVGGKVYGAGTCAVQMLNQYPVDYSGLRIVSQRVPIMIPLNMMAEGYLEPHWYMRAGECIRKVLDALPRFKPFDTMRLGAERQRVFELFMGENGDRIEDTFHHLAKVANLDYLSKRDHHLPEPEYFYPDIYRDAQETLKYYARLTQELETAHNKLEAFVPKAAESERLDETHLLPIAIEIFGEKPFPVKVEYISIPKAKGSTIMVTARKLTFESYLSFIMTDFFEGLHHGHFPRQCPICGRYFLMQSAIRQQYCSGNAPQKYKGESISCKKYAALQGSKERAVNDPVKAEYNRRCCSIRAEKSKGTITPEYAAGLCRLAKQRMEKAMEDDTYAAKQYHLDMAREKLYHDYELTVKKESGGTS